MLRERDGPPSAMLLALAGLAMGYAFSSEYPTFFAAVVLGGCSCSRAGLADAARRAAPRRRLRRAAASSGIVPLLLYNHYAFRSWTHLAYSDVPRQQKGFFGIGAPSLRVLSTLLLDSRGLLTISPVLIMGAIGTVLLYRRGKRAEALTIGGICVCFLRLQLRLLPALRRRLHGPALPRHDAAVPRLPDRARAQALPRPDDRARGDLDHDDGDRHDHAPAGRLRERDRHLDALPLQRLLPADDRLRLRPRARLGRHLAVPARRRRRRSWRRSGRRRGCDCPPPRCAGGVLALLGWALFAALAPTAAGDRPRRPARASTKPATTPPSTWRCTPARATR